jgi:hypothetical protein
MPKTLAERGFRRVTIRGHYRYHDGTTLVSAAVVDAERAKIARAAQREARAAERAADAARVERAAKRAEKLRAAARLTKPPVAKRGAEQTAPKPGRARKTDVEKLLRDAGLTGWRVEKQEPRTRAVRRARAEAAAAQAEADRRAVELGNLHEAQREARRLRDLDAARVDRARARGFHAVPEPAITAQDLLADVTVRGAVTRYRYRAGAVVNGKKVGGQLAEVRNFRALSPKRQAMLRREVFSKTATGALGARLAGLQHAMMVAAKLGQTWLQFGSDYLRAALRLSLV